MNFSLQGITRSTSVVEGPLPLMREFEQADDYPVEALGEVLGGACKAIYEGVQCSKAVAAQSLLAAASLAAQSHADVCIDGRVFPISLFFLTIAESGERKSSADRYALKAHKEFEKTKWEALKKEKAEFNNALDVYKKEREKVLKDGSLSAEQRKIALNQLIEPAEPVIPTLIVQEPTLEGLQKSFVTGLPSQGLFNDEGGQFFGGYAMGAENMLKSIAGLSKFWDGADIARTRAGEGESMVLFGKRLTVHLMAQPIVAEKFLNDSVLQGQGFLPRFLVSWPTPLSGQRKYVSTNLMEHPPLEIYWCAMRTLLESAQNHKADGPRKTLGMDQAAKGIWIEAYNRVEESQQKGFAFEHIKATASKAAEIMARIAAVLAITENPDAECISARHMQNAVILGQYYLNEAVRLQGLCPEEKNLKVANSLQDWLKHRDSDLISLVDVYQKSPRPLKIRSAKKARQVLAMLEEHKIIVRLPNGTKINGKHRQDVWRLLVPLDTE